MQRLGRAENNQYRRSSQGPASVGSTRQKESGRPICIMQIANIERAIKYASYSVHPKSRHGAIIDCNGFIYGGFNKSKTHPQSEKPWKTICAELDAVLVASRGGVGPDDFGRASLYIARVGKDGKVRPSPPCKWCKQMISKLGIRKVYHT